MKQICFGCKKEFEIRLCEKGRRNYCSRQCKHKHLTSMIICPICNNEFEINICRKDKAKFCSYKCYWKSNQSHKIVPCKICGKDVKVVPSNIYNNNYCSQECYQKVGRFGRKFSKETIEKIRESNFGQKRSEETKIRLKESRSKQIIPRINTSIETKIQQFLNLLGIEYYTHFYLKDILNKYRCDIFVPSMNLVIECDGDYWHGNPNRDDSEYTKRILKQRDLDKIRTIQILEKGYNILRLWGSEIKSMELKDFQERLKLQTN